MSLEARKKQFVQKFLKIQSEEVINRLEKVLSDESLYTEENFQSPFSEIELNKRVEQSELDFKSKRYKSSEELLAKYEQ